MDVIYFPFQLATKLVTMNGQMFICFLMVVICKKGEHSYILPCGIITFLILK